MSDREHFCDVAASASPHPIYCYRSGKYVYEEQFANGRLTAAGRNGAGYMLNVLDGTPTRFRTDIFGATETFALTADGVTLDRGWTAGEIAVTGDPDNACITYARLPLTNPSAKLSLDVQTGLDGTDFMIRSLVLTNLADKPVNIGNITVLGGLLERTPGYADYLASHNGKDLYSLGYFEYSHWAHEGAFRFHPLPETVFTVAGRYRANRYRHPYVLLRNNATGALYPIQFAWSGGYVFTFDLHTEGGCADLYFSVSTDGPEPYIHLAPGESYNTPAVHMGMLFGTLDDAVNGMHAHLRRSVFTLPAARGIEGGLVEAGMGPERIMDMAATRHFADTAAAVGAETLIIDAGWYCPLGKETTEWHQRAGDWYPDHDHYPDGICEASDYIHSKGLLFGLWIDLERIGKSSRLMAEHPDWALTTRAGGQTSLLNMADPTVASWVEEELARVLTEYKVDLFRLDYNTNIAEMSSPIDACGDGVQETCYARYYNAVYSMYERMRRRFPDVIFENCAGGGGRTDIGMTASFTHTWVSDWQVAPRSVAITNGMTMALPPERVDRLTSGMNSHERGSLELMTRQTLFGRPTTNAYNCVGSQMNPCQIDFVRHTFDIYKDFVRPFAPDGKIYHHTPEVWGEQPQGDVILERSSACGDRSLIGVFRLSDVSGGRADEALTVYPRGITPDGTYTVIYDNAGGDGSSVSGFEIVNSGLRVRLGGALTSELIILRRTDDK